MDYMNLELHTQCCMTWQWPLISSSKIINIKHFNKSVRRFARYSKATGKSIAISTAKNHNIINNIAVFFSP